MAVTYRLFRAGTVTFIRILIIIVLVLFKCDSMAVRQFSMKDAKFIVVKHFLETNYDTAFDSGDTEIINAAFDFIIAREGLTVVNSDGGK